MTFKEFMGALVETAAEAYHLAVLRSEVHRKTHFQENEDGNLAPRHTRRVMPHGGERKIPEHTQHNQGDFLLKKLQLETKTNLFQHKGELHTHIRDGLLQRSVPIKIKLNFKRFEPAEGVHAHNDEVVDHLKNHLKEQNSE